MWAVCKCELDIVKYFVEKKVDYKKNGYILVEEINNIKEKGELIENARVYVRKRFGWENIEKKYLSVLTFK